MLLLRPVKAKALTQGKAKALVPPTLILQIKAKKAKRPEGSKGSKPQRQQGPKRAEGRICRAHPGRWQGSSQRGLKITDSPHLFIHFLQFHFSLPLHLSLTPSTFAHPCHRLLPLFPILLLHAHSLPSANRTQSVIPAHSVLGFSPSLRHDPVGHSGPLGLLRVFFLSLLPLCSLGSVGHSGPLSPLLPLYLFSLLFSMLLHHCIDSVGHWSLATSSLFLASALPLFLVSPKPEPSRSFRPTRFLAASFLVLPLT